MLLALRSLTAHPLRSLLTALAIALGVAMVLAAASVGQAANDNAEALNASAERFDLEIARRDGAAINDALLEQLRAYPDIQQSTIKNQQSIFVTLREGVDLAALRALLADDLGAEYLVTQATNVGGVQFSVRLIQGLLVFVGVIILFAAVFVIANAFAMSLTTRQKEIGALRALGMTRAQVLQSVLWEAGALGVAGAAAGVLVGLGLAWLVLKIQGFTEYFIAPAWALVLSPFIGLITTLLAALLPARRASLISPLAAIRSSSTITHYTLRHTLSRLGLFLATFTLVTALAFTLRPDFLVGTLTLLPALVLVLGLLVWTLPTLVAPLASAVQPLLESLLGAAGRLAADNLRRHPARAATTAGALTAGLTMMILLSGLIPAMLKGGLEFFGTLIIEDRVILPAFTADTRLDNMVMQFTSAQPVAPPLRAALEQMAADGDIELARLGMWPVPSELSTLPNYPGVFVDEEIFFRHKGFEFFEGNPTDALALLRRGRAVLLQPMVAERLGVHAGDSVPVMTSQGELTFTVAGIGGVGWNMAALAYDDGPAYFNGGDPPFYGIFVAEGRNREAVLARVDELVAQYPSLQAASLLDSFEVFFRLLDQLTALLNSLLLLAVIVAALGVVNTLLINVAERKREIALLRAIGATQRQVRRAVLAEAALLGLFAALAAAAFSTALFGLWVIVFMPNGPASLGLQVTLAEMLALPTVQSGFGAMALMALFALFFAPALAAVAAYYPAKQAAAQDVAEATRSEELSLQPSSICRPEGENMDDRRPPRSLAWLLAGRALSQGRTRTVLSIIAIALGATMTVAGDVLSQSIISVVTRTEDLRAIGEGLWSQLDPAFKGIGAGIMLAAGFLIFNTFAMSLTQRRQQIGALRALGMTRGQVLRMALTEALLIGGTGTAIGLLLGPFVGQGIIAIMRSLDNAVLNAFVSSQPSPFSFVLAAVMGLGVTLIAALLPAQQAMKLSPLVALKSPDLPGIERNPKRIGFIGLALCLLLSAYLVFSPPATWLQPPYDQYAAFAAGALWILGLALMLPALVDVVAWSARGLLSIVRLPSAVFRLMADNLQRGRGRVLLTVITLAVSLTMIGSLTGFIQFYLFEFFGPKFDALKQDNAWVGSMMDIEAGLAGYADMESLRLPPEVLAALRETVGERGNFTPFGFVIVPELSFMGDTYFSFILNPRALREVGSLFMTFKTGDWETALPIMEKGCGLLMTPSVAARNNVSAVGDTLTVTSKYGPVTCTVAGIGSTFVGATIISDVAQESFDRGQPFSLFIQARPGVDHAQFEADLQKTADHYGAHLLRMSGFTDTMLSVFDNVPVLFNAFLLMAVLAAALGVVNTTLISVTERRREFGQLRALGATRAQVRAVVVGEAALMGLLGGLIGLVASVGLTVIFATVYGGGSVGVENYEPWAAALRTLPKVLPTGLFGVLASPLICALAAYFPANSILRGAAIETLQPEAQQPLTRQQIVNVFNRGSIQTRFVLGTSALLFIVLAVLIQVVTGHARNYLVSQITDSARAMVGWNATMVELALPKDAQTIDLAQLQATSGQSFDANSLLRFRSLIEQMSEGGLEAFAVTDQDNVVVVSFEPSEIGDTLEPLADPNKTTVREIAVEGEAQPRLSAIAPIRNSAGETVGAVRLTLRLTDLQNFLNRVRNVLWMAGAAIITLGLLLSWLMSAPFTRTARALATQASRVTRGDYSLITTHRSLLTFSLRTRLTILMTLLTVLLVGGMGFVVIPIEREELERTTQDGMLTSIQWIGDFLSASLPTEMPAAQDIDLARILQMGQALDFGKLQELTEQTRGQSMAYMTVADANGNIVLSDKLALIGETGVTATKPQISDGTWHDAPIWLASTPLRWGRDGAQIGTLSAGIARDGIEAFLDEARNLFWLTGLSAVLAGLLLAQVLGGAVAAPVENLVTGARRVAQGDLSVKFAVGAGLRPAPTSDELAQLAHAFNAMVAGLREREKLRDLFGKFVSPEVREAIESGRVTLAGERKTITVLYVDMRGSTAFAEKHKPEEVMSALNQYFEVIILATEAHGGIVNRFVGDEAVCIFGAPTAVRDHADRALQAALAMREGLAYLNRKRTTLNLPVLNFGMGLNSGEVVAGATGSEERQEYTLIGDAMNVGARIQDLTKTFSGHSLLLSEFTVASLVETHRGAPLLDLGLVDIRGKSQPVRVYGMAD